jgi:hypothetical protein
MVYETLLLVETVSTTTGEDDMRQRADGTYTHTTDAWDARWYWPTGTRVRIAVRGGSDETGVIIKQNATTVWVRFDSARADTKVPMTMLVRERVR